MLANNTGRVEGTKGVFLDEDRARVLRTICANGVVINDLLLNEQAALVEASMLGASLAMFALPGQDLGAVAKLCETPSRRRVFRAMRVLCQPGSLFRRDAERAGMTLTEPEIRANFVRFARSVSNLSARAQS